VWSLKYGTYEHIYKTDQRERTDLWLPRDKGCVGGKDGELRIRRCKLIGCVGGKDGELRFRRFKLIHRTDKQQGPTV